MNWKIITFCSLFFCGASFADTATDSNPCRNANTEADMYECLQQQLKIADAELNAAYKKLMGRYKDNGKPFGVDNTQDVYLRNTQRSWIKFRDTSCDFETYESQTGSGFQTIYTNCLLKLTRERVDYLQWFVQHP